MLSHHYLHSFSALADIISSIKTREKEKEGYEQPVDAHGAAASNSFAPQHRHFQPSQVFARLNLCIIERVCVCIYV